MESPNSNVIKAMEMNARRFLTLEMFDFRFAFG